PTPPRAAAPPPESRSGLLRKALLGRAPVGAIELSDVALSLVRAAKGQAVERLALGGLRLQLACAPDGPGFVVRAEAGTAEAPLALDLSREPAQGAPAAGRARLALSLVAEQAQVTLGLDLRLERQSFVPGLAVERLLQLDGSASFQPERQVTALRLRRLLAVDGAIDARAEVELPDEPATPAAPAAPTRILAAEAELDLGRLAALVPATLLPVQLDRGTLHARADGLSRDRAGATGTLTLDGDVRGLRAEVGGRRLGARAMRLSVKLAPEGKAAALSASLGLVGLSAQGGGAPAELDRLDVTLAGRDAAGALSGKGSLHFGALSEGAPRSTERATRRGHPRSDEGARAEDGSVGFQLRELRLRGTNVTGALDVTSTLGALALRQPGARAQAQGLALRLQARRTGDGPWTGELALPIDRLRLTGLGDRLRFDGPLRFEATLADFALDALRPLDSRARASGKLSAGPLALSADWRSEGGSASVSVDGQTEQLALLAPFVPAGMTLPLGQMSLGWRTEAQLEGLSSDEPRLRERTTLTLAKPKLTTPSLSAAARELALTLSSSGDRRRQSLDFELALRALALGDGPPGDGRLTGHATLNADAPSVEATLATAGEAFPAGELELSGRFERGHRALAATLGGKLSGLGPLARLLPSGSPLEGSGLKELSVTLSAHGSVSGPFAAATDGLPRLARPLSTARGDGELQLKLTPIRLRGEGWSVQTPTAALTLTARADGATRALTSELRLGPIEGAWQGHPFQAAGLESRLTADLPSVGPSGATLALGVRELQQTLAPELPVGDFALTLALARAGDRALELRRLVFESVASGTSLTLAGGLVLDEERKKLALRGQLLQDLGRLTGAPDRFVGHGALSVDFRVESPDLETFRTTGDVKVAGAMLRLPDQGIAVTAINGDVPVAVDLSRAGGAIRLLRDAEPNPYSMFRFEDQHPLLRQSSFLSIGSLVTPDVSISPLVGNLRIERNVLALSQLELGVRSGRVTGQCIVDWAGNDTRVQARVRANGVLSSHGEPFDGSASLVISTRERSIDGHAEILRIGRRHLLDLLDLQDPQRTNPAMNRIRGALALGYPDHVRLLFDHGFASARFAFGGLARLVHVDDLRGIPTEPLVDQLLAKLNKPQERP
ncbi:MAG: hypothetical protein ACYCWW_03410, partial [Deltaproteobacteria bacterium]